MARNAEENVYVTIAFSRNSSTWRQLQREATDLNISVAHLIKVLLADRTAALEGQGKQLWFPREVSQVRLQSSPLPRTELPPQSTEPPPQSVEDDASRRAAAAASAASYWED